MKKGQAALELLINYGWVVIIITMVLGTLFALGAFNAESNMAEKNTDPTASIIVTAHKLDANALTITLKNTEIKQIEVKSIELGGDVEGELDLSGVTVSQGRESALISVPVSSIKNGNNDLNYFSVVVKYELASGLIEEASISSLVLRASEGGGEQQPPQQPPQEPQEYIVNIPDTALTFSGPENKSILITLNKTCQASSVNMTLTGNAVKTGGDFDYYSLRDERESDGVAEYIYQTTVGNVYDANESYSYLITNASSSASISSFLINITYRTGQPQNKNFIYNVSMCYTNLPELTGWSTQCTGLETVVRENANMSSLFGTTFGMKNISFSTLYTIEAGKNYIVRLTFVNSINATTGMNFWYTKADRYRPHTYITMYNGKGATTAYKSIAEIKLQGGNYSYPSNTWIDVSNDGSHEWSQAGNLSSSVAVSGLESSIGAALAGCATQTCSIPIVFHSDTIGEPAVSNFKVGC